MSEEKKGAEVPKHIVVHSDMLLCMKDFMVTVKIEIEGSPAVAKEILTNFKVGAKFMVDAGNEFDNGLINALKTLRDSHE